MWGDFLESFLNSGGVKLIATVGVGVFLYMLYRQKPSLIYLLAFAISSGILVSFIFFVGEVYSYSWYYRRAFFVFGDSITTVLVLLFCYCFVQKRKLLAIMTGSAIILSGARISWLLWFLCMTILTFGENGEHTKKLRHSFAKYLGFSVVVYALALFLARIVSFGGVSAERIPTIENPTPGWAACESLPKCIITRIQKPLEQRVLSSAAGVWLILNDDYRAVWNSSTASDKALLMSEVNPLGVNDYFELDYADWLRVGNVSNPYLRVGSQVGFFPVLLLMLGLASLCMVGINNLLSDVQQASKQASKKVFVVFYGIVVFCDFSQPWILAGNTILIAVSFCGADILYQWIKRQSWIRLPCSH